MAPPQGAGTQVGQPGQQPPAQQSWSQTIFGVVRMGLFWYFVMQFFGPKKVSNPALLTDNLFTKGEKLVLPRPYTRPYGLIFSCDIVFFLACIID